MRSPAPLLVASAFLLVTLSGCLGGDDVGPSEEATLAADAAVTERTGSITGEVVALDLTPIQDAQILLRNKNESWLAESDPFGRYTFNHLRPAHYAIEVAADGFLPQRESAVVVAGNVTNLSFLMEPEVKLQPYAETREFIGAYECAFGVEAVAARRADSCTFAIRTAYDYIEGLGQDPPFPRDPGNTENTFWWTVEPNIRAVFSEVTWDTGPTVPSQLRMTFGAGPIDVRTDKPRYEIMDTTVEDPGRAVIGFGLESNYGDAQVFNSLDDEDIFKRALDWANGTLPVQSRIFPGYDYQVAYGLKFTMYVTAFYDTLPRSDFTALPDQ